MTDDRLPALGYGFQYKRHPGSAWESWNLRPEETRAAEHHHRQFLEHCEAGRCAAVTALAPVLDWSVLHPALAPARAAPEAGA